MKNIALIVTLLTVTAGAPTAGASQTYTGIITDTMCGRSHAAMKVTPDGKCVNECVGDRRTYKYALLDGDKLYTLSDQETPARFAGRKVTVSGVLYPKTNVLKVESIAEKR